MPERYTSIFFEFDITLSSWVSRDVPTTGSEQRSRPALYKTPVRSSTETTVFDRDPA